MPKAGDLKKGDVVEIDGTPHVVKLLEARSPSSRGASTIYKIRFNNLVTGQKRDESVKSDHMFALADAQHVPIQYSYLDGAHYVFMNAEDYTQYFLDADALEGQIEYLMDGIEDMSGLLVDGILVAINLPQSVIMEVTETAPGIKGASASARTKPASGATGLVIQVPEYIEQGESIKINTTNGKFMSRA